MEQAGKETAPLLAEALVKKELRAVTPTNQPVHLAVAKSGRVQGYTAEKTNLTELAEFFPSGRRAAATPSRVTAMPMLQDGETAEQAVKRQDDRKARILARKAATGAA
jgi:hypothetical protein